MMLKKAGFFSELPEADRIAELERLRGKLSKDRARKVVEYLNGGAVVGIAMGTENDVLVPEQPIIGTIDTLTDGKWAWQRTLSYWVSNYHVGLPEAFVLDMESNGWVCPRVENVDALAVEGEHEMT